MELKLISKYSKTYLPGPFVFFLSSQLWYLFLPIHPDEPHGKDLSQLVSFPYMFS